MSRSSGLRLEERLPEIWPHNLETIRSELTKLKGKPKEAEAYLAKASRTTPEAGAMTEPMSAAELFDACDARSTSRPQRTC